MTAAPNGWRAFAHRLTAAQVEYLTAMERHPAYIGRPEHLLIKAVGYAERGCAAEFCQPEGLDLRSRRGPRHPVAGRRTGGQKSRP